jgi:LPXTG-motif cell wall-anchored protein
VFARTAAGAVAFLILAALTLVGVACAGLAIDFALAPAVGSAWAAALTAFIMLIAPVTIWIVLAVRGAESGPKEGEEALLRALAALAKGNPIMALLGAGLLGAAGVLLRRRRL